VRVVHIYKGFAPIPGGIEGHVETLARALRAQDVYAEVLCARPKGSVAMEIRDGVPVHRCRAPLEAFSTPLPPGLPKALRQSGADLVHLHQPWPPGDVAWLLGGRRRPLVVTLHCEVLRYPRLARVLDPLTRRVLRRAGRVLVSSPSLARLPLLERLGERVRVIPYGVDLDRFRPDPSAPDPLPEVQRPRVLFVGRLRHYKGLPVLARALAMLPEAQLVVVGDGPEREPLERALREAGCRDRAHLLGEVDAAELVNLYRSADAAVLASTSPAETFGIAIAEAQACGLLAVTTDVGTGTGLTVDEGRSGRVVAPGDAAALAEALRWCLDPARAPELRAAARTHAETALSATRMAEDVARAYREVLGGG
jgi:rhamnosyl/mannosyltransferase